MIEIRNIVTGYGKDRIIDNLSLKLDEGEFCSLLGPNGAGKSTLLRTMVGYKPIWEGEILFNSQNIKNISRKEMAKLIAIIPQEINMQFDYPVRDLVLMGRYPYLSYWQKYSPEDRCQVDKILGELDLTKLKDKNYSELSGGEKQRVNIARALAQDSDTILMDESLVHLDINHQLEIIHLLSEINKQRHKTILLVSHNINLAADYSKRIIIIKEGKTILDGTPESIINKENIRMVYDAELETITNSSSGKPNVLYPGKGE